MVQPISQDAMRSRNLQLMLQMLFNHSETSRIKIAKTLNLNKSTISSLYTTLDQQGYITELGQGVSSEAGGRRPILITFNRHYGYTANFELGHHHLRMMINWLNGEKISFISLPVIDLDIHAIVTLMKTQLDQIKIPTAIHGLVGISIAINGIVDHNQIVDSPFIAMQDVDLTAALATYQVPVRLENEANLAAIAASDYLKHTTEKNLIALDVHNGIGAGIIINNKLYRGRTGQAGEMGRSIFTVDPAVAKTQSIENLFSEDAVISRLAQLKQQPLDRERFLQLYRADDPDAQRLIQEFLNALGLIIFNIDQSFSPDIIYLQSRIVGELPHLLDTVRATYQTLAGASTLKIELSPMIEDAPVYGGAALITHHILDLDGFELHLKR